MNGEAFRVEQLDGLTVIEMPAEIDVTNADQARQALLAAIGQNVSVLIVDMTETAFCDSAGVAALVAAYRQANTSGTRLLLVAPKIGRILELTGFGAIVPMHPTLDDAHAAANQHSRD